MEQLIFWIYNGLCNNSRGTIEEWNNKRRRHSELNEQLNSSNGKMEEFIFSIFNELCNSLNGATEQWNNVEEITTTYPTNQTDYWSEEPTTNSA